MKLKQKKNAKITLSDKIADALTLKPRADIEDDQVFGTKPKTLSRADFGSSDSEDEAAISEFRRRNVNLLSDVSKKYEGQVVSRKDLQSDSEGSDDSDDGLPQNGNAKEQESESEIDQSLSQSQDSELESDEDTNDQIAQFKKQIQESDDDDDDVESEDYSINQSKRKDKVSDTKIAALKKKIEASDNSEGESDDYSITQSKKSEADDDESDDDDEDEEGYDISQLEEPMLENFEHVKKQNLSEEAKKGICVRNQLLVWEGLLEIRIHMQRCVNTANQMPLPETYGELHKQNEFTEESNTVKTNIANVLDKLLSLQNLLLKNFPETKSLSSKKTEKDDKQSKKDESDEEIPSDTDNEEIPSDTEPEDNVEETKSPTKTPQKTASVKKRKLGDYESEISTTHKSFKNFRDTSIQKWNDKTRLATATNIKNQPTNTILQQISYILSDRDKLIKRTQLKRSEYDIVGYKKEPADKENDVENELNPVTRSRKDDDEYIPEIFDDSDFYHQLLRELIECKSADISDPVQLSRQWIALQQMRSKMKRKVDTKATKGRKIKYVVHNKLLNYMAPEKSTKWTDESTNELYSSLFGKLFEHNNAGLNGNVGNVFQLK